MLETAFTDFELYRQMAANIPNCSIYLFDHEFNYLLAEGEEIKNLGMTSEMLAGSNFFEIWPQEVTVQLAPYYEATLKGQRQIVERKEGNLFFIHHFIPIVNESGAVNCGMLVSQNISELQSVRQELQKADDMLAQQRKLFEMIVKTSSDGMLVCDRNGKILISNPAAREILEIDTRENSVKNIEKRITISNNQGIELPKAAYPLFIALTGGSIDGYETFVTNNATKKTFYTENSARPIFNEKGKVEGAILVFKDITSRKKIDQQLQNNLVSLTTQNFQLETLINTLSTSFRGAAGNLQIITSLLEKSPNEDIEIYTNKLQDLSKSLYNNIDLLSLMAIEFRKENLTVSNVNFNDLSHDFLKKNEGEILNKGVTVNFNFTEAPEVIFPQRFVRSIIFNLLENALTSLQPNTKGIIKVKSAQVHNKTVLTVSDNGCGIDLSKYGKKLFELRQMPLKKKNNKGVGLYLNKCMLDLMGGTINVESEIGKGTTFTVIF